jgi:hypothetical protein
MVTPAGPDLWTYEKKKKDGTFCVKKQFVCKESLGFDEERLMLKYAARGKPTQL